MHAPCKSLAVLLWLCHKTRELSQCGGRHEAEIDEELPPANYDNDDTCLAFISVVSKDAV